MFNLKFKLFRVLRSASESPAGRAESLIFQLEVTGIIELERGDSENYNLKLNLKRLLQLEDYSATASGTQAGNVRLLRSSSRATPPAAPSCSPASSSSSPLHAKRP